MHRLQSIENLVCYRLLIAMRFRRKSKLFGSQLCARWSAAQISGDMRNHMRLISGGCIHATEEGNIDRRESRLSMVLNRHGSMQSIENWCIAWLMGEGKKRPAFWRKYEWGKQASATGHESQFSPNVCNKSAERYRHQLFQHLRNQCIIGSESHVQMVINSVRVFFSCVCLCLGCFREPARKGLTQMRVCII